MSTWWPRIAPPVSWARTSRRGRRAVRRDVHAAAERDHGGVDRDRLQELQRQRLTDGEADPVQRHVLSPGAGRPTAGAQRERDRPDFGSSSNRPPASTAPRRPNPSSDRWACHRRSPSLRHRGHRSGRCARRCRCRHPPSTVPRRNRANRSDTCPESPGALTSLPTNHHSGAGQYSVIVTCFSHAPRACLPGGAAGTCEGAAVPAGPLSPPPPELGAARSHRRPGSQSQRSREPSPLPAAYVES